MTTKDYLFRILALIVVWTGIVGLCWDSAILIITDLFDLTLALAMFSAACALTFVVWCGPDMVRWLWKHDSTPRKR